MVRTKTYPDGLTITVETPPRKQRPRKTFRQVRRRFLANGLTPEIAERLNVTIGNQYRSQTSTSVGGVEPNYTRFSADMYLNIRMAGTAHSVIGHEYGHAWSLYHLYLTQGGDWTAYLQARGLSDDARLDSSYYWDKREIIADDYRLLLGSSVSHEEWPYHLNRELPHPRDVVGLKDFLTKEWAA